MDLRVNAKHISWRPADIASLVAFGLLVLALGSVMSYLVSRHGEVGTHGRILFGAPSYALFADNILEHGRYVGDAGEALERMPLYVGLVMLAKIVGRDYWSHVLIALQGALALLCGVMLNRAAAYLVRSSWVPAVVTLAYAAHFGLQVEHFALRETVLYEFLVVSLFYLALLRPMTRRNLILMTLTAALGYYTRPTGVFLVVPLAVIAAMRPDMTLGARTRAVAVTVGGVVLCAVPWQIYQSHAKGELTLNATQVGGLQIYKGSSEAFENVSPYIDHDLAEAFTDRLRSELEVRRASAGEPVSPAAEDQYLRQLATADIRDNYARYLRKTVLRVMAYLSPLETPLGSADVFLLPHKIVLNDYRGNFVDADAGWLPFLGQLSFFVVLFGLPLGLLGAIRGIGSGSDCRPVAIASLGFILANLAVHAAITAETRYRLYLDPIFLIWSAVALAGIFPPRGGPVALAADAIPVRRGDRENAD